MDNSHGHVEFDLHGVCEYCLKYQRSQLKTESRQDLELVISKIKKNRRYSSYDCVLGVSGGVDSSYLAVLCREKGLRPLAVHVDNGWNSAFAVLNIEKLCRKLEIDLFTYLIDWQEFRDIQRSFLLAGLPNLEAPSDHAIFAGLRKVAREQKVSVILTGVNDATEQLVVDGKFGRDFRDGELIRSVHRKFGHRPLATFPLETFWKKIIYKKLRPVPEISLLNHVPYEKKLAEKVLHEKIDYVSYPGKHGESIMTRFNQYVYLPQKFNLDIRRIHLSNLIFSGQITRHEAMEELQKPALPAHVVREDTKFVLKKLGVTEGEFRSLLQVSPGCYRNFKNSEAYEKAYDTFSRNWLKLRSRLYGKN